jgi:gamma-glutamyltranspeptidase/glutathione hydrolase
MESRVLVGPFATAMGNGEAVMRDSKRSVNFGASDPGTDSAAIPQQPNVTAVK